MKYIILILFLTQIGVSQAQQDPVVSSTIPDFTTGVGSSPFAGQASYLWVPFSFISCNLGGAINVHIDYTQNVVDAFIQFEGGICGGPPLPTYVQIAEIRGLDAGVYTMNYYQVPEGVSLPPPTADAANYLFYSTNFGVMEVISVDATSRYSLFVLIMLILAFNVYFFKRTRN